MSWEWRKADRQGLARLDYTQNAINKTLIAPFSTRPAAGAPVSVPVRWDELDDLGLRPDRWMVRTVLDRLEEAGDPLRPLIGMLRSRCRRGRARDHPARPDKGHQTGIAGGRSGYTAAVTTNRSLLLVAVACFAITAISAFTASVNVNELGFLALGLAAWAASYLAPALPGRAGGWRSGHRSRRYSDSTFG